MRILVTTTPGLGHILPVRRLASDLVERGYELRWVVGPGNVDVLVDVGFDVMTAGISVADRQAEFNRRYPDTAWPTSSRLSSVARRRASWHPVDNAANVERRGAGMTLLGPSAVDGESLGHALHRLLETPSPKAAAEGVSEEIAQMPAVAAVADAVEAHVGLP